MFFEPNTSTGCGVFAILGRLFDHFFSSNRFLDRKDTKEYNLVSSRHFKRVKDSVPVDMHYSKTSFFKLPYNETRSKTRSRRGSRIKTDRFPKRAPKAQAFAGFGGMSQWKFFFDFNFPKSPFLGF